MTRQMNEVVRVVCYLYVTGTGVAPSVFKARINECAEFRLKGVSRLAGGILR